MRIPDMRRLTVAKETVRHISSLLLTDERWTRRALAEKAEVSSMTVGKIVAAWGEAALLTENLTPIERGRNPREIRLAERSIAWGILRMEEKGCSLVVVTARGVRLRQHSIPYDAAMSPEDNGAVLRGRWHATRSELEESYAVVGLGVILRESPVPYWEQVVRDGIGAEADCVDREEALTAKAMRKLAAREPALYLCLGHQIRAILVIGESWTENKRVINGGERYETLTEAILQTASMIPLGSIVAESHGRYEGDAKRLLHRLERRWRTELDRPCPELILSESLTFAEKAAIESLNDLLAKRLAEQMGKEQSPTCIF